jgi:cardiolipin synthase A/B
MNNPVRFLTRRRPVVQPPPEPVDTAIPQALLRYTQKRTHWRPGNQLQLLRDGDQTFPAQLAAIAAAKRSVCLEVYIFEHDVIGRKFVDAMCERARAGVTVRFLYDGIGSFSLPDSVLEEMSKSGVELVEFHPVAPWRSRFNWKLRDHRKILVVDDEIAFVGGLNIGKEYASKEQGGEGWHDMHCSLRGPIVSDLARTFRRNWVSNGGRDYQAAPRAETVTPGPGNSFVRMIDNTLNRRRRPIRQAYMAVIAAAQRQVLIKNAYFLPDRALRRAMSRAVARGVEVAVVVPGRSDVRMVEWAGHYIHRWMARAGVRILLWPDVMMHAKTAVIDGVWSTIGSYNLDARSLRYNLEITVEILDEQVGGELTRQFLHDELGCERYDDRSWQAMPWWQRARAWVAYRFRRWL